MNTDTNNAKPLLLLQQAFDALDTDDSEIDCFESEEEEAEYAPQQYACRKIMEVMDMIRAENRAAGGASALTDVLEHMRAGADNAYCDYIGLCRRDECLGEEIKIERHIFGAPELKAHRDAAEKLGRHRALQEAANMLAEVLRSNA